jgi:hypothetical protein
MTQGPAGRFPAGPFLVWAARAGYTRGMKTAISVPDDVFQQSERLAARTAKSRSQLYTEAMREYIERHDPETVTDRLDAVVDELGPQEDRFVATLARDVLARVEW